MEKKQKESSATIADEGLALFVRSSPAELEASELQLVAGGIGTCIVPLG
jgi:hypothetical protein